jgi:uncharacterized protein (TIGR03437 family)
VQQVLNLSLTGPAANPTQLSVTPASTVLTASAGAGPSESATLTVNTTNPTDQWTLSVFPANRTTAWLGASQFAGTGPAHVALAASPAGFEPGAYRANLLFQSPNAVPQTVDVPVMFVIGTSAPGSAITAVLNPASYSPAVAPGIVVAVFGTNLSSTTDTATGTLLPYSLDGITAAVNGIGAPLVYVSPTQINIQIPYDAGAGPAVLGINNNGQILGFQFTISPAAPALLTDAAGNLSPTASVPQGGTATLLLVGAGEVADQLPTAYASPSTGYQPMLPVSVTVGGSPAFVQSVGQALNQFGVTQVSFTLPASVTKGVQPVVVTVGGIASPSANITVQ